MVASKECKSDIWSNEMILELVSVDKLTGVSKTCLYIYPCGYLDIYMGGETIVRMMCYMACSSVGLPEW